MVYDQVDKLNLASAKCLPCKKGRQRPFSSLSVHANQRTSEYAKALRLSLGTVEIVRSANSTLNKDAFELVEIACSQGLVHPQLADRDVILVSSQERLRFG